MRTMNVGLCLVIGVVCACGGATTTLGNGDGGSGSGSSSGAGSSGGGSSGGAGGSSGGGTTPCPPTAPASGGNCSPAGLVCEYGTNVNPSCNESTTCEASGTWTVSPSGTDCSPATCPASYADVPQGKACTPSGLDCAYPEGQCDCAGTVPVTGPNPVWQCVMPGNGCPEPRPEIGSPCTTPGQSCDYGPCIGGVQLSCKGGIWVRVATPCPV